MTQSLAPFNNPEPVLLASTTLDGIAGSAIWASRLGPLKSWLFTPEGTTGALFTTPALLSALRFNSLHAFNLPLLDADLPVVETVLNRPGLTTKVWLDHHYFSRVQQLGLLRNGVELITDPRHVLSSRLLLDYLPEPDPWMRELVAALEQGPETAVEPWLSWLLVFLAVREEPSGIRQAISPLADRRFEAFDPALRAIGCSRWRQMQELAAGAMHELEIGAYRMVVLGLPYSHQEDYHLLVQTVFRQKKAHLALVFFDGVPRMIFKIDPSLQGEVDLLLCSEHFEREGFQAWHYDPVTLFLQNDRLNPLTAIERALTVLRLHAPTCH